MEETPRCGILGWCWSCNSERTDSLSDLSNVIILQGILPAYCIPKVVKLKPGEVLYEKAFMSPRPPPKISLRHDWNKGVKFHWALQLINNQKEKLFDSHKKKLLDEQNYSNQPNQSQKPIRVRPGQPDNTQDVNGVQHMSVWKKQECQSWANSWWTKATW